MKVPLPFLHRWSRLKWGHGFALDGRECRICGRFEVWVYTGWRGVLRRNYEPTALPKGAK